MQKMYVLVTGATGNLGKSVVSALQQQGYGVVGTGHPQSNQTGQQSELMIPADLAQPDGVRQLFASIASAELRLAGGMFIAGGFAPGSLEQVNQKVLEDQLSLNFMTAILPAIQLVEVFKKQNSGGRILFTGSMPGLDPKASTGSVAYGLSKSLLFHLSGIINANSDKTNIRSSVLVPTTMDTPENRAAMPKADFSKWLTTQQVAEAAVSFIAGNSDLPVIRFDS